MPTFIPLEVGVLIEASRSNVTAFSWATQGCSIEFLIPADGEKVLRVTFHQPCIARLLDEMALSTEDDDTPCEGLINDHLAYRVEDAAFAKAQSTAWKDAFGPVSHYQFITGWTCVDVLSAAQPVFEVVARPRS